MSSRLDANCPFGRLLDIYQDSPCTGHNDLVLACDGLVSALVPRGWIAIPIASAAEHIALSVLSRISSGQDDALGPPTCRARDTRLRGPVNTGSGEFRTGLEYLPRHNAW